MLTRAVPQFGARSIPHLTRVRQNLRADAIFDTRSDVRQKLGESGYFDQLTPGSKIGITAGSRGGRGFVPLMQGIVDAVKAVRCEPFLIPAMGSHGGATAEGQVEVLGHLGVTDETIGAPVRATMRTRELGVSETGAMSHIDEIAAAADGVIVVGRTKTHPENREGVASGLLKMVTVGLGKQAGAHEAHSHGLWESVRSVPKTTLGVAKIVCGVAVVENAFRHPAIIEIVPPKFESFLDADMRLLEAGRPYVADLPFDQLDVLIVDRLGKDISGTGMDLNVIGKWRVEGGPREPDFRRIVVLSLTAASLGNGLGVGLADFTTQRFVREFDWQSTYINLFTATEPDAMNTREGQLPFAFASDREAIGAGIFSSLAPMDARICRIESTADLEHLFISKALVKEIEGDERFSIEGPPAALTFDSDGNLF